MLEDISNISESTSYHLYSPVLQQCYPTTPMNTRGVPFN